MNTIILIGWLGNKIAYLNISKDKAIKRYLEVNLCIDYNYLIDNDLIDEFKFNDEFKCYDIWG